MSLLIAAFSADSVVVCSEDRAVVLDEKENILSTVDGRVKNIAITPSIVFGAVGRSIVTDCMMLFLKEFSCLSFARLAEIIPTMAHTLIACAGQCPNQGAGAAMLLAGWDSEQSRMRMVCWEVRSEETEVVELDAVAGGMRVMVRGPEKAQQLAQQFIMESTQRVPACFPEVFAQVAARRPEVGRVVTTNTVMRPSVKTTQQHKPIQFAQDTLNLGSGTKISWTAINVYNPDGTTTAVPASTDPSQIATVPTPTLSTVVGGSKPLRTYFVRLAYTLDGVIRGFGPEASISVPANSLLKVTSPTIAPPWETYHVFIAQTSNAEIEESLTADGGNDNGIPSGTDFIESTAAMATVRGPMYSDILSKGIDGAINTCVPYNIGLLFYPYWDSQKSVVRFYNGLAIGTASTPDRVRGMYLDGHLALSAAGLKFTTITTTQGSAGTTTGVANTGGCPIVGTKIVPIGYSCMTSRKKNSLWAEVELEDGRVLTATPDHPVYTPEKGKIQLRKIKVGNELVTDAGLVKVVRAEKKTLDSEMEIVTMIEGHTYYANGILSHNIKLPAT